MILGPPELPAVCGSCGHRVAFGRITERCYLVLLDADLHRELADELRMLNKVADFYRRNPSSAGAIQPHAVRALRSREPRVLRQLFRNVPVAQIKLPPALEPKIEREHPDDREVIEYLRRSSFRLDARMQWVAEAVERLKGSVDRVSCPKCRAGRMRLAPRGVGGPAAR